MKSHLVNVNSGKLVLDLTVVPTTTATGIVPTKGPDSLTEKGTEGPLDAQRSVQIGSGNYVFEMPYAVADRDEKE